MMLNFCMQLDIHRSNKFIQIFQMGAVKHAYACPNLCQIVSQLYGRSELSCKVVFCIWLGIQRTYKFVQSFQVDKDIPKALKTS